MNDFKIGDPVVWKTGGWWKNVRATVIGFSKSGQRVKIKYVPPKSHWERHSMVTREKLSPLKTVLEFQGERHELTS